MTTWRDRPICGFDLETTASDPEAARVVTACIGRAHASTGWKASLWLLAQDEPIPAEATAVHGITTEEANAKGADPAGGLGLSSIRDELYEAWRDQLPVAGHNIVYDFTVLDRDLRRNGLGPLEIRGDVVDILVIDKALDRYRRGSRRLADVAAHYGVILTAEQAHSADADALTAARLAWILANRVPRGVALTDWQAEQYAEQRRSFAAYRRRKGDPLDDESEYWPIRPYRPEMVRLPGV